MLSATIDHQFSPWEIAALFGSADEKDLKEIAAELGDDAHRVARIFGARPRRERYTLDEMQDVLNLADRGDWAAVHNWLRREVNDLMPRPVFVSDRTAADARPGSKR